MILTFGLTYVLLGILINIAHYIQPDLKSRSTGQIALHFIMFGSFMTLIHILGFYMLFFKYWGIFIALLSVIMFMILVGLEMSSSFRYYRDRKDE